MSGITIPAPALALGALLAGRLDRLPIAAPKAFVVDQRDIVGPGGEHG